MLWVIKFRTCGARLVIGQRAPNVRIHPLAKNGHAEQWLLDGVAGWLLVQSLWFSPLVRAPDLRSVPPSLCVTCGRACQDTRA
jgi:hypothetical protein